MSVIVSYNRRMFLRVESSVLCIDACQPKLRKTTFTATGVPCSSGIAALSEPTGDPPTPTRCRA